MMESSGDKQSNGNGILLVDPHASDDELEATISELADQLRQSGRVETAHYLGVAALTLQNSE